ncbi:MAG: acyl-CoA-binding protein [Gemmatimonadetes bacterium]|nr:acyl-CoA-binding protein [Gemmatimonadota bacterium]
MPELEDRFRTAVAFVQNADGDFKPSNELKLRMYCLYKQATQGDVTGKKPGMIDFVARAKWEAWEGLKGLSADEAMEQYVNEVEKLRAELE